MTNGHVYPGGRVDRDDPRYDTLRRGFNLRWAGDPSEIAVCGDAEQVRAVVQRAVDHQLRLTVRSGGHCYENFAVQNDGGILVDMAAMNRVYYDDARRAYCIEAGTTLWNAIWTLYKEYGRAIPGGSCYSVGAGGHITGGGYGLLSRKYGLIVDHLTAVELVHVTREGRAEIVIAGKDGSDDERDLLWANQGGGGGNFGIVTRFWFDDLPPAPSEAHVVNLAWNWNDLDEDELSQLITAYGRFLEANSGADSDYDGLFTLLHLTPKAASQIVLTAQYVGDAPKRLSDVTDFLYANGLRAPAVPQTHAIGRHYFPLGTMKIQRLPWLYATQTLDGSGPNQRGKYKSAYMKKAFPQSQIATIWKYLNAPFQNPQALLQVDSYGCRINRVASDATAVPQRSSIMKLQYQTYWVHEEDTDANLRWIDDFYVAMYGQAGPRPDDTMDGCYVNYPDVDLPDWEHLYYLGNYARLQRVKARWDPHAVFHHAQSIRLPHG